MTLRSLAAAAVLGFALPAGAQSVRVVPDRTSMAMGETITLTVSIEGQFDDATGPDMPDFDVVGRSSGTSISIVNGSVQREQRVTLTLSPRRTGNLTIGAVQARVGGRTVASSKPLAIRVGGRGSPAQPAPPQPVPGGQAPGEAPAPAAPPVGPGAAVPEKYAGQSGFLLARAPDRVVYAGEPVYAEYVLYTRSDLPLTGLRVEGVPKLRKFVVEQPKGSDGDARRVMVKGVAFDARVQWRGAVTALEAGEAVLDPMTVVVSVGDFFSAKRYRVTSDPVALDFKAVPSKDRPADYAEGTLGRFAVKATLDKTAVTVGEAAVLTVEVTGAGNLRAVRAPDIPPREGLRISRVPASDLDDLVVDVGGVSGKRAFQYLLAAERPGEYEIGRLSLSFFDTMSGKYERSRSEPIKLTAVSAAGGPVHRVEKGEPVVGIVASSNLAPPPGGVKPDVWDSVAAVYNPFVSHDSGPAGEDLGSVLGLGLGLPLGAFLAVEAAVRRRAWVEANMMPLARRRALRNARDALGRIGTGRNEDGAGFWGAVDGVIREYLGARFGLRPQGMTGDELKGALVAAGVAAATAGRLLAEMENCAFGRFAPSVAMDRDRVEAVARVVQVLVEVEKAARGRTGT